MLKSSLYAGAAILLAAGHAQAEGFYLKAWGGFANLSDSDVTGTGGAASGAASFDSGPAVGGAFGYIYPGDRLRAEVEFGYRSGDTSSISGALGGSGDFAATILMVNGYYSFPTATASRWTPYVGAGLGYVTEIDFDVAGGASPGEYSDRGGLAGQIMAGVDYALSDQLTLNTELRYVSAGSVDLAGPGGSQLSADFDSLDVLIGLRFNF
ncbi:outer membrane protein [Thalassococcus sp. S3]|uniref:outer membrane protein n=1 Tax=Thalassococcus sp. S3 TaxID=2017482 RepID=UPI001024825D|nr:OmpW family outer membrane protein [Thalassococcus sp. S3]QBF33185.1 hypothetical protein CFI11_18420 [Thalassococcus sp. S3]